MKLNNCPKCNCDLLDEDLEGNKITIKDLGLCWECQDYVQPVEAGYCFRKRSGCDVRS